MNTLRAASRLRQQLSYFPRTTTSTTTNTIKPAAFVRPLATMASTTSTSNYKFNHSMIRVKDPEKSIKFYNHLGLTLLKKLPFPDAKFDLYFLGYDSPQSPSHGNEIWDREGLIELTHNYGTESDPEFKVNNGNRDPDRGFGHTCISVDNIQAACKRIEDAGYKFQKKLTDGRMRHIAFVLDPDEYWVEVIGQKPVEETEHVETTDPATYKMNHTMLRIKDAEKSLKFYQDVLGMSLYRTNENEKNGFNLYFLGYPGEKGVPQGYQADREGILELTWNYGTEKDEKFHYYDGNSKDSEGRQGFGHICISVDNIEAACQRFDEKGVTWKKKLTDGRMKNIAFLLDPDGYWIEVVQNERFSGKKNF